MSELVVEMKDVEKIYKVHQREEGLLASFNSLFNRQYKYVQAIKGVNLQITKGEIRGLIGPNGAGKSTTIKILSGVLTPSSGEVNVIGMIPWAQREMYVKNLGVVFGQKSQLWWDLPAIDTYGLQKEMYKINEKDYRERLLYFTELLNIQEVMKKPVRQLSLGERMKCELVCAMLHEPQLIFLDEPTIGIDIVSKQIIRAFIKKVNKEKQTTFILTTHDLDDLEDLCEKITIINKGTVVYDGLLEGVRSLLPAKKLVEVKFSKEVHEEDLAEFTIKEFNSLTATIELDFNSDIDLTTQLYTIMKAFPVQDININNIKIEEVIKHIYMS